jgi:hypothetical protein
MGARVEADAAADAFQSKAMTAAAEGIDPALIAIRRAKLP